MKTNRVIISAIIKEAQQLLVECDNLLEADVNDKQYCKEVRGDIIDRAKATVEEAEKLQENLFEA